MDKFCLIPEKIDAFKKALLNRNIEISDLLTMSSKDRTELLREYAGENASQVNLEFERKLILKNKTQGIKNWLNKLAGMGKYSEERKAQINQALKDYQNQQQERIFNPKEDEAFLNDLANKRLGATVTQEEAKKIYDLTKTANTLKEESLNDPTNTQKQEDYGMATIQVQNYKNELMPKSTDLTSNVISMLNTPRSLVASFDVSAPFRHAWGSTTRGAFWKNYVKMYQYLGSQNAFDRTMGRIVGNPDYALLKKSGVRISELSAGLSKREDQFMSPILDKIPLIKGSERSYIGFLNGLRADMFYNMLRSARLRGEDVSENSPVLKELGNIANIFTGTANVGRFEPASEVFNAVNFSFRKTAGDIKMLNPLTYIDPRTSPTARREALRNIIGSLGLATSILIGAKLAGFGVETDPRSTDFGKVKIGNRRIDVTGGRASMVTLISRLLTNQTKSSTTGIITTLGQGYKPQTRMGLVLNFERNKLSPNTSAIVDFLVGSDFAGKPVTLGGTVYKLFTPMLIQDAVELANSNNGFDFMGTSMSLFGIPVSSYAASSTDWTASQSTKIQEFQSKVSSVAFNKANQEYNNRVNTKIQQLQNNPRYTALSGTDQQKVLTNAKNKIENSIFRKYSFHYKTKRNPNRALFKQLSQ